MFIDESVHVWLQERVWEENRLFDTRFKRLGTVWALVPFQPHVAEPIFLARTVILLSILPAIAALLKVAHLVAGQRGLFAVGLLVLLSPYHYFFNRMALGDPISAAPILVAIYLAFRSRYRFSYFDAALCGLALFAGVFTKTVVLPYLGVPLAAMLTVPKWSISKRVRWLGVSLGAALIPMLVLETIFTLRGQDWLSETLRYSPTAESGGAILDRLAPNLQELLDLLTHYLSVPGLGIVLIGIGLAVWQRQWFWLLVTLAPAGALAITATQETRYWIAPMYLLLLLTGIVYVRLLQNTQGYRVLLLGIFAWGAMLWLPMVIGVNTNPLGLNLPPEDRHEYLNADGTGFGFAEIADHIPSENRPEILGILSNCQGLRYTYWDTYEVLCRPIRPNGRDIPVMLNWVEESRGVVPYVVLEESIFLPDSIEGEEIVYIERPRSRANLTIYSIQPE